MLGFTRGPRMSRPGHIFYPNHISKQKLWAEREDEEAFYTFMTLGRPTTIALGLTHSSTPVWVAGSINLNHYIQYSVAIYI